jgi:hypothetical protein
MQDVSILERMNCLSSTYSKIISPDDAILIYLFVTCIGGRHYVLASRITRTIGLAIAAPSNRQERANDAPTKVTILASTYYRNTPTVRGHHFLEETSENYSTVSSLITADRARTYYATRYSLVLL